MTLDEYKTELDELQALLTDMESGRRPDQKQGPLKAALGCLAYQLETAAWNKGYEGDAYELAARARKMARPLDWEK